jgi:hypothetical protein
VPQPIRCCRTATARRTELNPSQASAQHAPPVPRQFGEGRVVSLSSGTSMASSGRKGHLGECVAHRGRHNVARIANPLVGDQCQRLVGRGCAPGPNLLPDFSRNPWGSQRPGGKDRRRAGESLSNNPTALLMNDERVPAHLVARRALQSRRRMIRRRAGLRSCSACDGRRKCRLRCWWDCGGHGLLMLLRRSRSDRV